MCLDKLDKWDSAFAGCCKLRVVKLPHLSRKLLTGTHGIFTACYLLKEVYYQNKKSGIQKFLLPEQVASVAFIKI